MRMQCGTLLEAKTTKSEIGGEDHLEIRLEDTSRLRHTEVGLLWFAVPCVWICYWSPLSKEISMDGNEELVSWNEER